MSKYTTELRYICEVAAGLGESVGYNDVENVIQKAIPVIFNFKFPIFDEKYRNVLLTKILRHFYTREIGFETVGLWKLKLNAKLNEIMPYYNQLYKSELMEFNPFYDVDITTTRKIDREGTRDTDSTSDTSFSESGETTHSTSANTEVVEMEAKEDESKGIQRYSDTPQGALSNLESNTYLTSATINDNTGNTTGNRTGTTETNGDSTGETESESYTNTESNVKSNMTDTEDYLETVKGKRGGLNYSDMLLKYRDTFLNIDMLVISELDDLFMCLW